MLRLMLCVIILSASHAPTQAKEKTTVKTVYAACQSGMAPVITASGKIKCCGFDRSGKGTLVKCGK